MGIAVEAFSERYLGLPTAVGRITSGTFDHIGERIHNKLHGGSERMVSCAGKETLLKSVVQAIPTYTMSCFKLTKKVYKDIMSCMAWYWWSSSLDRHSMHWISWEQLASPKIAGGMGFRDLESFNLALLGKHGWRLMTSPDSLCGRVLKGRYFPDTDFMQAGIPRRSSAIWRSIIAGRTALEKGMIKRVGDGSSISIWTDKWILGKLSMSPVAHIGEETLHRVSELMSEDRNSWDIQKIRKNFIAPDADAILNIPIRSGGDDHCVVVVKQHMPQGGLNGGRLYTGGSGRGKAR
jgi:hypothetical protein